MARSAIALLAAINILCLSSSAILGQDDVPPPPPDGDATVAEALEEPNPFEDDPLATLSLSDSESCGYQTASDCGGCDAGCGPVQCVLADFAALGSLGAAGFQTRGWLAQGLTYNAESPPDNANSPVTFNDRANEYQMNQAYAILQRPVATGGCCWDLGGRVDVLFGTDYYFTSALGWELNSDGTQNWNATGPRGVGAGSAALYGLALPQLYAELYAPIAGGVNVKFGHFYSPLGYERVMAPENFFYSHSYAFQYGEPKTLTGAVAEHQLTCNLRLRLGGTLGWNSFDSSRRQWGILGGLEWTSCDDCTSLAFTFHTGEDDLPGVNVPAWTFAPDDPDNVTVYSLVLKHLITHRVQYVFQNDFGVEQDGEQAGDFRNAAKWYGINQYLLYCVNDCWSLGMRFEWFRDQDFTRVYAIQGDNSMATGGNYYALTFGGNWTPCHNLVFRPEIRWDWSDTDAPWIGGPFDTLTKDNQLTAAFDLVIQF